MVNIKKIFAACLLTLGILLQYSCNVFATIDTEFIVEQMPIEEKMQIAENQKVLYCDEFENTGQIECFAVREDGYIVVGNYVPAPPKISVFSPDGKFLYSYTFDLYGAFELAWNGDNILIYSVRGEFVTVLSPNGDVLDVYKLANCDANDAQWKKLHEQSIWVGDATYRIENKTGFWRSTSNIIRQGDDGTETLVSMTYPSSLPLLPIIGVVIALSLGYVVVIVRK